MVNIDNEGKSDILYYVFVVLIFGRTAREVLKPQFMEESL